MKIVKLDRTQLAQLLGQVCRAQSTRSAGMPIDIFDDETFVGVIDDLPTKRSRAKVTIKHLRSV